MADRIFFSMVRQAREALAKACLLTHATSDYLTREMIDELRDSGLNWLKVAGLSRQ